MTASQLLAYIAFLDERIAANRKAIVAKLAAIRAARRAA